MPVLKVPVHGDLQDIDIPTWVTDLDSFRRWVHSGVLPEKLSVHFIGGDVWIDFMSEEAFSHNQVKAALDIGLGGLIRSGRLGLYMPDGMLLTNDAAGLGTDPDAMFVSKETLAAGRVGFTAGKKPGAVATEMIGSPDLVVEVVSPSSEDKDLEKLMSQYFDADIREYWVIDARDETIRFDIYKRGAKEFVPVRRRDGWSKSPVLGRSFRLVREVQPHGIQVYDLEVR